MEVRTITKSYVIMTEAEKNTFAGKMIAWYRANDGPNKGAEFEKIIEFMEAQVVIAFDLGVDSERGD